MELVYLTITMILTQPATSTERQPTGRLKRVEAGRDHLLRDGTSEDDVFLGGAMGDNGSVILVGSSYGVWDGSNKGGKDFVAVKLDTDKNVLWKWQGGTEGDDCLTGAAVSSGDGTVFLGGYTTGLWGDLHAGGYDFAGVQLNLSDGSELWRWQDGTPEDDLLLDVSGGTDGLVILAGETEGSWGQENSGGNDSFAMILDTNPAPATSEPTSLTGYTSLAPQPEVPTNYPLSIRSFPDTIMPSTEDTTPAPTTSRSTTPTNAPLPAPSYSDTTNTPISARSYSDTFSPSMKDRPPAPTLNTPGTPTNVPLPALSVSDTASPSTNLIDSEENRTDFSSNNASSLIAIASAIAVFVLLASLVIYVLVRRRRKVRMIGPVVTDSASLRIPSSKDPETDGGCEDGFLPSCRHSVTNRATLVAPKSVTSLTEISWGVSSYSEEGGMLSMNQRKTHEPTTSEATDEIATSVNDELSKLDVYNRARQGTPSRNFLQNVRSSSSKSLVSTRSGRIVPTALLDGTGTAEAMHDVAKKIMESCSVPVVREIAILTPVLANLSVKKTGNAMDRQRKMTRCWKILEILRWAAELVGKGPNNRIESEPLPLKWFHDAVHHLVELIKEHQSKNKLTQFMMSSVFQRLQEGAEEAVDGALLRLHMSLVKASAKVESEQETSPEEVRHLRRKHQLDQIEIPADVIEITDQQLGRGGFGAVYFASYKGQKAAAKVISIEQTLGEECNLEENASNTDRAKTIRNEFLLELEAMMRLRSPYTVDVFGAVTTRKHTLVLVMELLPGGDLRSLLRNAKEKLPEAKVRQITMDVCKGMVFLHSKDTIHGDIKSPNVLFDGAGRAKIADFGTSRWIRHANSTGLATYKTKAFTHMSIAWAAPEVLDAEVPSFPSDVYSFGVVMWEILSREKPWSNENRPREIMARVFKGDRLHISDTFPGDLAGIMKACWADEPGNRPTAEDILKRLKSRE